jgi:hypothetical protein
MEDHHFQTIAAKVPEGRYRTLLRQVLDRLPEGWDDYRTFDVQLSDEMPERGYASARRDEALESGNEDPIVEDNTAQVWEIILYRPWLDRFPDEAVAWVIAHELGHVASGIPCGIGTNEGSPITRIPGTLDEYRLITPEERARHEGTADGIARDWGFSHEQEAFESEGK